MKTVTINQIHIENFKGFKDKTFDFDGKTSVVKGKNASGKTTIANAFYWLLNDKDIDLNSNPNVKPIGVAECQPTVAVTLTIDGKEVELCKSQKIKVSEPDENGVVKSSSSNTYMVNSVPKTERDFKAYLEELGLPTTDTMLMMSHTDVFTGMKNADMRKVLFEMVTDHSDKDIANKMGNVPELAAFLDNYKLEEVEAIQKSSMKKINDRLESIPSQIEGLELAKTEDKDTAEVELLIQSFNKDIADKQLKMDEIKAESNKYSSLLTEKMRLDFDRNTELQRMNETANQGREELEKSINRSCNALVDAKKHFSVIKNEIDQYEQSLKNSKNNFESLKKTFTDAKALVFDESKTICPCCGQAYPEDKKAEIKDAFEQDKKSKMDNANIQAKSVQKDIKAVENVLLGLRDELSKAKFDVEALEEQNKQLNYDLENFKPSEVAETPELKAIDTKIAELNKAIEEIKAHNNDTRLAECNAHIAELNRQLAEANKVLGSNSNNVRIDAQIEDLQTEQGELEQSKANCEKILFQIELLSKEKNNVVANEINSYFDLVEFRLWEQQKNGTFKDSCVATYKGKELGVSTNTALQVAMKLDICKGLQKFNNCEMPIFVDNAECLDTDSYHGIGCDCQIIFLAVTDDDLTVVKGE